MLEQAWKVNSQDSILHCLPLHHVHGLINALLLPLATGADIHMLPGFKSADQIWQSLLENDVNLFMAVPTIYSRLVDLENVSSFNRQKIQNLKFSDKFRLLISGSAALPDPIFKKFENLSGGYQLLERYGMTEFCMGISNQIEGPKFPGFVGRELPGVEVRITDENGHILHQTGKNLESALAENLPISGNLLIKTPGMFSKYLNKPQATLETFTADGWFITGDQIQLDPNGLFKILGRSSTDIIKSGGYKISALEIEAKILQANSDLISECAVFGMADDDLGEKIVCLYVVKQGRHVEQKLNFDNLVKYQRPKILQRQDQPLLRNVMGKLNKKVIKQQFLEVQN